jgi:excisionase family DNA binding protein
VTTDDRSPAGPEPLAYSYDDLVRVFPIGLTKARELVQAGELDAVRVGRRVLIIRESVVSYMERHRLYDTGGADDGQAS